MKSKFENEKDAYSSCVADGYIKEVFAVNKEKVRVLLKNAGIAADSAEFLAKVTKSFINCEFTCINCEFT